LMSMPISTSSCSASSSFCPFVRLGFERICPRRGQAGVASVLTTPCLRKM
jgi:hypothetical protein